MYGGGRAVCRTLIDCLKQFGVPRCPGNTMVNNPQWYYPVSGWKQILYSWIMVPVPKNMVNLGMFQDMRVLHGDLQFEEQLLHHIYETARDNAIFFPVWRATLSDSSHQWGCLDGCCWSPEMFNRDSATAVIRFKCRSAQMNIYFWQRALSAAVVRSSLFS